MHVEAALVELRLASAESLKDKRRVVRGLIDAARRRFGASLAEVGDQNLLRRAEIGVAVVSGSAARAREDMDAILRWIEENAEAEATVLGRDSLTLG
ncbi:MAG: DUF503 domain-containing protein [Fimbriimonadales bacterium]|nr:DUF503 domain-containing protein [Fimbriimonadales bacterium]